MKKKQIHTKRILSLLMALMLAVSLVFSVAISASADTKANEAVVKVKDSVLQFNMVYEPGHSMPSLSLASGSCFLINPTTILTCQHCVLPDEDDVARLTAAYRAVGYKNFKYDAKNLSYSVVVNGGMLVNATLKNSSANDYAILTLNSTVKRDAVTIGYSDELEKTQSVYNLGYPGGVKWLQDSITYTEEKLSITSSTVSNLNEISGVKLIQYNAAIQGGNSGGPVVDEDGYVVGICGYSNTSDSKFSFAIAIDQVKAALDDLAIEYQTPDGSSNSDTEETVETDTAATETTEATEATTAAPTEPEPDPVDTTKLIIIIAIIAVVIIIVVIVILIIVNSKKKNGGNNNGGNGPTPPAPPVPPMGGGQRPAPPVPPTAPSNEGAGETSVLGEGAGETTVLGSQSQGFTLLRKRNNEKIKITKAEFVIGKERRKVDYCVSDNSSISRAHAKIKVRGGRCYISDLNSTNCTYVNGTRLSPNQEVILSKGDSIKISDEEFEFLG